MNQEFREFARSRAAPLRRAAYLLCGDWHLADDIAQETLVKTYRHWSQVRRAENPDAYVRRILVNETNRHWKRQRSVAVPAERTSDEPIELDDVGRAIDRMALLQALEQLTPRQRATVVLRYFEGFSERATAQALGCSEGTVKSQTSRALRALSTFFQPQEIQR